MEYSIAKRLIDKVLFHHLMGVEDPHLLRSATVREARRILGDRFVLPTGDTGPLPCLFTLQWLKDHNYTLVPGPSRAIPVAEIIRERGRLVHLSSAAQANLKGLHLAPEHWMAVGIGMIPGSRDRAQMAFPRRKVNPLYRVDGEALPSLGQVLWAELMLKRAGSSARVIVNDGTSDQMGVARDAENRLEWFYVSRWRGGISITHDIDCTMGYGFGARLQLYA